MRQHPDFRTGSPEVAISDPRLAQVTEYVPVVDSPVGVSSHPGLVGDQVDDRSIETSLSLELPEAVLPITTDDVLPDLTVSASSHPGLSPNDLSQSILTGTTDSLIKKDAPTELVSDFSSHPGWVGDQVGLDDSGVTSNFSLLQVDEQHERSSILGTTLFPAVVPGEGVSDTP